MTFTDRLARLPRLGLGLSTEYGAIDTPGALDPLEVRARAPECAGFLELGVEYAKGLDRAAEAWAARYPVTYHFLDINLDDPDDFDPEWLSGTAALIRRLRPAWACGDAGLWHLGRRDRGQMLLLPPILTAGSADRIAAGVARLRGAWGVEVLPENPPGVAYVGDMHLLDFFARVLDRADTGMLLDCAHLAIYQHLRGGDPLDGLDGFPLDRVVEIHIAGSNNRLYNGFSYIEDSHSTAILPQTLRIVERVLAGATNLRAVVFECERNGIEEVIPAFRQIREMILRHRPELAVEIAGAAGVTGAAGERAVETGYFDCNICIINVTHDVSPQASAVGADPAGVDPARLQRGAVRLLHDPEAVARVYAGEGRLEPLSKQEIALLRHVDRRAWGVEPRRAGLVAALIEEFPVTAALLGVGAIEALLSEAALWRGALGGPGASGSVAVSAAALLEARRPILWPALVEGAVARARRPWASAPIRAEIAVAPGVVVRELAAGSLAEWQRLRGLVTPASVAAGARLRAQAGGRGREWLVAQPGAEGPQLSIQPEGVAGLLLFLAPGRSVAAAAAWLGRQGVEPGEAGEVLAGFEADGLIVREPSGGKAGEVAR